MMEISMTLDELQELGKEEEKTYNNNSFTMNRFAVYIGANGDQKETQLLTLDNKFTPTKPLRRVGCHQCLRQRIRCQDCRSCLKGDKKKICCRGLGCVYQYSHWMNNKQKDIYKRCHCQSINNYPVIEAGFEIDWRLLQLLMKVNSKDNIKNDNKLNFEGGLLWIQYKNQSNQKQLIFQDNFSYLFYDQGSQTSLKENNLQAVSNIFKKHLVRYLSDKTSWNTSNLQEQCEIIKEQFAYRNQEMAELKTKINTGAFTSGKSLFREGKEEIIQQGPQNTIKDILQNFIHIENPFLTFYFSLKQEKIYIRHAHLQQNDPEYHNLRCYPVQLIEQYSADIDFQHAVWFKDRTGDIFSIKDRYICIYKFYPEWQCFVELLLATNERLKIIKSSRQIVYNSRKDVLYCIDPKNFKNSFLVYLYRGGEKKISRSCAAVKFEQFESAQKVDLKSDSCLLFCIMADIKNKNNILKTLPVIYLLTNQEFNSPLPLGMHKLIYEDSETKVTSLISDGGITEKKQNQPKLNLETGCFFIFKNKRPYTFYLYAELGDVPTLMQASIQPTNDKIHESIEWKSHRLEPSVFDESTKKELMSGLSKEQRKVWQAETKYKIRWGQEQINQQGNCIFINDLAGVAMNNQIRFMGFSSKNNHIVQVIFSCMEGTVKLDIYDFM